MRVTSTELKIQLAQKPLFEDNTLPTDDTNLIQFIINLLVIIELH